MVSGFFIKEELALIVLGEVEGEAEANEHQRVLWVLQLGLDHLKELPC
jgi:hypothetical protein